MNENVQKYIKMLKDTYVSFFSDKTLEECKEYLLHKGSFSPFALRQCENILLGSFDYSKCGALDFGCGIGRLIKFFQPRFRFIDGADLSGVLIEHAKIYCGVENTIFHITNGYDLNNIIDSYYDVVYSMSVLEHICVHEIRNNLFKEFYRVLKTGGHILIAMQGGNNYLTNAPGVLWYDNFYDATGTNHRCDVKVTDLFAVAQDLNSIGYNNISYNIQVYNQETMKSINSPAHSGHQFMFVIKAYK